MLLAKSWRSPHRITPWTIQKYQHHNSYIILYYLACTLASGITRHPFTSYTITVTEITSIRGEVEGALRTAITQRPRDANLALTVSRYLVTWLSASDITSTRLSNRSVHTIAIMNYYCSYYIFHIISTDWTCWSCDFNTLQWSNNQVYIGGGGQNTDVLHAGVDLPLPIENHRKPVYN